MRFAKKIIFLIYIPLLILPLSFAFANQTAGLNYYSDSDVPYIYPRSTWDNTPSLNSLLTWLPAENSQPPDYQPVERFVIHYTATPNEDPINAISRIQSIYRYHSITRGWGDIGYNYIIDQNGKIFEGKYGGNGVRAAHAFNDKTKENFNVGTIGIALMGTFLEQDAPEAAYNSLSRLIGWLSANNEIDPTESKKQSAIWNANTSGFTSVYIGPAVIGHQDIDTGKIDPGLLDMERVKKEASEFLEKFKSYAYKPTNDEKYYLFKKGEPIMFANLDELKSNGVNYTKIVALEQNQLNLFPKNKFPKYADNTLLGVHTSSTVYIIKEQKKRAFETSSEQFKKLGFNMEDIKYVSHGDLNYADSSLPIKYAPDKKIILGADNKVYYTENGKKKWVPSLTLFNKLKYNWSNVGNAGEEIQYYLNGKVMPYPDNTLLGATGSPEVYVMEKGKKRHIISAQIFSLNKYQWKNIIMIPTEELANYETGQFLGYPENYLAKSADSPTVYLLNGNSRQPFLTASSFINLGYRWADISTIARKEMDFYTEGTAIRYPDNTLVKKEGEPTVYVVKQNILEAIPDPETFNARKYRWNDILRLSIPDFAAHFLGAVAANQSSDSQNNSSSQKVAQTEQKIRIGIYAVPENETTQITANGTFLYCQNTTNDNCQKKLSNEIIYIAYAKNGVHRFVPEDNSTIIEVKSYSDRPAWKPSLNYNRFRGTIEMKYSSYSDKLWVVNELPMENYLRGVAEALNADKPEYQKAFSIITRSYATFHLQNGGKYGAEEIFHLKNTATDQIYKGYVFETIGPNLVSAVQQTKGKIITYKGSIARTLYSSDSGGVTKDVCEAFGDYFCNPEYDYLRGGVIDPAETVHEDAKISASHGVGMSAIGARKLAEQGKSAEEIIKYYYLGVEIEQK